MILLKKRIQASEVTWYEDGFLIEWWINDSIKPEDKRCEYGSLKEAFEIARENQIILFIQPMYQDQCLIVDFTPNQMSIGVQINSEGELLTVVDKNEDSEISVLKNTIKSLKGKIPQEIFEEYLEDLI